MSRPTAAQLAWDGLQSFEGSRATFEELRKLLKLSKQTLRAALLSNPTVFAPTRDCRWRLRAGAPRPLSRNEINGQNRRHRMAESLVVVGSLLGYAELTKDRRHRVAEPLVVVAAPEPAQHASAAVLNAWLTSAPVRVGPQGVAQ